MRQYLNKFQIRKVSAHLLLVVPVFIYGGGLLLSKNKLPPGDGDYYIQLYEAARRSLLEFHQLPMWNPWIAGGVPLFANPQFGFISIQMITTLIFGSIFGYKLALIIYLAIGFMGMRHLMIQTYSADKLLSTLLSYIWVFSSFFVYRSGGHYTFFVIAYLPWMLHYFIQRSVKNNWIWLSLFSSALIWSSLHYTTVLSFLIIGLFGLMELVVCMYLHRRSANLKEFMIKVLQDLHIKKLAYSAILILILTFPRLYSTAEFTHDYPRILSNVKEIGAGPYKTLYALFAPDQYQSVPTDIMWGWHEYSTYVGILTGFSLLIACYLFASHKKYRNKENIWLVALTSLCLLLAQGDFASWAPFTLFRELPVFSSMRVASRWINWSSFFMLLFVASVVTKNIKLKKPVAILLTISVVELFIVGSRRLNNPYILPLVIRDDGASTFSQRESWHQKREGVPYDENFTEATRNNIGQIIAGDSLIDTRQPTMPTTRCDEATSGCQQISSNAEITKWSPNSIEIKRLGAGPIELNMNPGSRWLVNGFAAYRDLKIVDPASKFIITDPSDSILLTYSVALSIP